MRAHSIENFNGKTYARTDYKTIERKHCGKLKEEKTPQDEQAQALQALQGEPSQEAHLGLLRRRFAPPPKGGGLRSEKFSRLFAPEKTFPKILSSRSQCERRFFVRTAPFTPAAPLGFHTAFENKSLPWRGIAPPRRSRGSPTCADEAPDRIRSIAVNHIFPFTSPRPALKSAQICPQ